MAEQIYKTILDYYIHCRKISTEKALPPDDVGFINDDSVFNVDGQNETTLSFKELQSKTQTSGVLFSPDPLVKNKEAGRFTLFQIERPPEAMTSPGLVLEDKGVQHILIHHSHFVSPDELDAYRAILLRGLTDTGCRPVAVTRINTTAKILNPGFLEYDKHYLWQKHKDFRGWASLECLPIGVADPNAVISCPTRFLCKGGSFLIVAPSGIGKSTLMMQMAISWSINRDFFGLQPKSSLRCLLLQGENDDGDVAEMAQGIKAGLQLTQNEISELHRNFAMKSLFGILWETTFIGILSELIELHKPDVFFVDPLFAFLKGDFSSQEMITEQLRRQIDPVLKRTGCILVATHHTPKPSRDGSRTGVIDFSYAGFGTSEMTNWFRAVATLRPEKGMPKTFRFIVAKRGARAGLHSGLNYCLMKHSEKGLFWEAIPNKPIIPSSGSLTKFEREGRRLLKNINLIAPLSRDMIIAEIMKSAGCQPRQAANYWGAIKKHFVKVGKEYTFIPPDRVPSTTTLDSVDSVEATSSVPSPVLIPKPVPKNQSDKPASLR